MTDQTKLPPAAWYPDPAGAPHQRWWDGTGWTDHTQPSPQPAPAPPVPVSHFGDTWGSSHVAPAVTSFASEAMPSPAYSSSPQGKKGKEKNSAATSALILGIIALVAIPLVPFKWIPALVGVGAIVWGIIGIRHARIWQAGKAKAIWGLVLGTVALPIALIALIATSPSFQQGLQDGENAARFNKVQVEKDIKAGVEEQTGTALESVQCPETPTVKEGASFECVARTTDGTNVLVNVRVQDNKGNYIWEVTG